MGNYRGNTYSRAHKDPNMDPDKSTDYWNFSFDEMGKHDLPSMISLALEESGQTWYYFYIY